MAIDASIPLSYKPAVTLTDPMDQASKAMALRNQALQGQLGQQQLAAGGLSLQQTQREVQDQQMFSQAMQETGGDPQKAMMRAAQLGMSGKGLVGLQQSLLKNQETQSIIKKNTGEADSAAAAAQERHNEMVGGTTQAMLNLPPEQRAAAYVTMMPKLAKDMGVDPASLPQDYNAFGGDAKLLQFHNQYLTTKVQLDQQKEAREAASQAAEDKRKADLAKPTLDKITNEATTSRPDPVTGLTREQTQTAAQAAATLAEMKRRNDQTTKNENAQRGIEAAKLKLDQKKFDATLGSGLDANGKPLSPEDRKAAALLDPTAIAQANYQIPPPPQMLRGGAPNPQYAKMLAINPQYDGMKYAERNKIAQDFSAAGASGKQMTSTDTALAHLDAVRRAGEALKNSDPRFINAIANEFGVQVGSTPKNTYDAIINMVSPEISKAVIGEAGGQSEREEFKRPFSSSASDAQREAAVGATAGLLGARYHKMGQAYESDMGKPLERKLSPESQGILDRYTKPAGAAAVIPTPTTQADYNALAKGAQFKKPNDSTIYTKQ